MIYFVTSFHRVDADSPEQALEEAAYCVQHGGNPPVPCGAQGRVDVHEALEQMALGETA